MVRDASVFDVIVTTNMFGDILSDEAGEIAGSPGLAASLNAGTDHTVAWSCRPAPGRCGRRRTRPTA